MYIICSLAMRSASLFPPGQGAGEWQTAEGFLLRHGFGGCGNTGTRAKRGTAALTKEETELIIDIFDKRSERIP
jgi:hypothetical protein